MTLRVTDHALVRFLERAGGLDVEALRRAIAASLARAEQAASSIGAHEYVITAEGHSYVVKGGQVVTVIDGPFDAHRRGSI
jgi:hypothetical protein